MKSIKNVIDLEEETYKQRKSALLEKINVYKHIIRNSSTANFSSNNSILANKSKNDNGNSSKIKITNNSFYEVDYEINKTEICNEIKTLEFFQENKSNFNMSNKVNLSFYIFIVIYLGK